METKKCPKCGRMLTISEFNKSSKAKDGLQAYCRKCQNEMTHNAYIKRRLKGEKHSIETIVNAGTSNPDLSKFHPRELIAELQARGYKGKLYITREVIV